MPSTSYKQAANIQGGLAFCFARVKRYRLDEKPEHADTIDTVRHIYKQQSGKSLSYESLQLPY
jgi:hypothetical protein